MSRPGASQRRTPAEGARALAQRTSPRSTAARGSGTRRPRAGASPAPALAMPSWWTARTGSPHARQRALLVGVLTILCVFAGRLVYVQAVQGPELAAEALAGRLVSGELVPKRGDILDATGTVLATSVTRYDVLVDQTLVPDWKRVEDGKLLGQGAEALAEVLAPILARPEAELAADLVGDRRGKYIARGVLPETWAAVKALRIAFINAEETSERKYPNGNVAGNVLGFVNSEGVGSAGVEQSQESQLRGTNGSYLLEQDPRGALIPTGEKERVEAVNGRDTELTIHSDLQWKAQSAIEAAKRTYGATYANIVVSDTRTGQILALAETDTVDPANLAKTDPSNWGSRAISTVFEPGSTAKVITMAAALETGAWTPASKFTVPYTYVTDNKQTIRDSHAHPDQRLTLAGVFAESSNTGTVMIGEKIPMQVRYDYLEKFGFGQTTGIGLPGESAGILHPVEKWDGRTRWNVLFGQGVAVTAIQSNEVFATIANGGVRNSPRIIKGYRNADGTYEPVAPAETTRVVSEETADTVLAMMETVVSEGTGQKAAIPGYRVAGKTGTAQAPNPLTGTYDHYVASFNGIAPADDPRIAVSVSLYADKLLYGGSSAGPVFSDVTAFALQYLGIEPSGSKATKFPTEW
ncbi:peptidoglycan D,D-transpeptidase FtsI family protein [Sanguibacter sp. A247]|uniref:peptidoglycan D,D-transpeptidase FtsI family protein n=1 Tax=unclassified Sanguibacter TaxID=2645534 RepID=UPI003FD8E295